MGLLLKWSIVKTMLLQLGVIALLKTGLGVYDHHTLTLMYLCMSRCPWGQGYFKCPQKSRFAVGTVCLTGLF